MKLLSMMLDPAHPDRARLMAAAPDFVMALIFLVAWIAPHTFGEAAILNLAYVLIFEFVILHSAAVIVAIILGDFSPKSGRNILIGLSLFYLLFAFGMSQIVGGIWPIITIAVLTLNRMLTLRQTHQGPRRKRFGIVVTWALTFGLYIAAMIIGAAFPWPALGLDASVVAYLTSQGSGSMFELPQTTMAFGLLYFGSLGLADWFGVFDKITNRIADRVLRADGLFGLFLGLFNPEHLPDRPSSLDSES